MQVNQQAQAVLIMQGIGVSRGVVMGRAIVMGAVNLEVPHYLIAESDIPKEFARLDAALKAVYEELISIKQNLPADAPQELAPLINVHSLLVSDPTLAKQTKALIRDKFYNAEWALSTQGQTLADQFAAMQDEYIRERAADINQVIERTLNVLMGSKSKLFDMATNVAKLQSSIVVAHDISPADMMNMRNAQFTGFLTDLGGATSHTAIVARAMRVPAVVGLGNVRSLVRDHDLLIVDGSDGLVIVNPSSNILRYYQEKERKLQQTKDFFYSQKNMPSITLDGQKILVEGNIEFPEEADQVLEYGGEGVGLFRTEFLFMGNRAKLPSEDEQYEAYAHVMKKMSHRPVTIRTLDIGSDKTLNDESTVAVNPALGLRAVRYCLANPEMFMTQIRALLRASVHGERLKILVPMIAHIHEIRMVRLLIQKATQELQGQGIDVNPNIELGAMVEIPAIAIAIEPFLKELDFVSIGTNDLIQYTLAIDRVDNAVSHLYDPLHPAVLRLIAMTIQAGEKANKNVAVCGEMAGDYLYTRLLLGLGLKEFSMSPAEIPEIKHIIRQSHTGMNRRRVAPALNYADSIHLDSIGLMIDPSNIQ